MYHGQVINKCQDQHQFLKQAVNSTDLGPSLEGHLSSVLWTNWHPGWAMWWEHSQSPLKLLCKGIFCNNPASNLSPHPVKYPDLRTCFIAFLWLASVFLLRGYPSFFGFLTYLAYKFQIQEFRKFGKSPKFLLHFSHVTPKDKCATEYQKEWG